MSEEQKEQAASAREAQLNAKQTEVEGINSKRTGKGTRLRAGQTRGKNPQVVVWEAFDEAQPDTMPESLDEFMKLTETKDEKLIVQYLVDGYNSAQYTQASDPVAEFVEASWSEDTQRQFRMAVRNYASAAQVSIEDAAALIKPGILKSLAAKG